MSDEKKALYYPVVHCPVCAGSMKNDTESIERVIYCTYNVCSEYEIKYFAPVVSFELERARQ